MQQIKREAPIDTVPLVIRFIKVYNIKSVISRFLQYRHCDKIYNCAIPIASVPIPVFLALLPPAADHLQ